MADNPDPYQFFDDWCRANAYDDWDLFEQIDAFYAGYEFPGSDDEEPVDRFTMDDWDYTMQRAGTPLECGTRV